LSGATATPGKPVKCGSRSTRPRSSAFAFVTLVSISTGRWTRTRHSRWLESLRPTPRCGAAVVGTGLMPLATSERAATARVRRGAIARRLHHGRWMPLGQPERFHPRRLPCLGRRARAMYALSRLEGRPCRRWLTPGSSRSPACGPLLSARTDGVSSVETQWGYGMGDHGEVVEWLELVCCVRTCFVGCLSKAPLFPSRALLK